MSRHAKVIGVNSDFSIEWKCVKEHSFTRTAQEIKNGLWCPICQIKAEDFIEKYQNKARSKRGRLISTEYINAKTKLTWCCEFGHEWNALPYSIMAESWCPICNGNRKYSIEDMKKIALEKGGDCLSSEYKNNTTDLTWKCKKGHKWDSTPSNIIRGLWCQECAKEKRRIKFQKQIPEKLKELRNLASRFKGRLISSDYKNTHSNVLWECEHGHRWENSPHDVKKGFWCQECEEKLSFSIYDMQDLARKKGGDCISKEYINAKIPLLWECKEGHRWEMTYDTIKKGIWCLECNGRLSLSIYDMQDLAAKKGGECLSKKYINAKSLLRWKCGKNHEWDTSYDIIKSDSWCPYCVKHVAPTIPELRQTARNKGGMLLSSVQKKSDEKYLWKCKLGHIWLALGYNVKVKGTWCPKCAPKNRKNSRKRS